MTVDALLRPRRILVVTVVPLVALGLYILMVNLARLVRYDPVFFSEAYVEEYSTPRAIYENLEAALQTGDQALLIELQGLRWPRSFPTGNIIWRNCTEVGNDYLTYLYQDMDTWERYSYNTVYVNGRWIVSTMDADYYLRSGRWVWTFGPIAFLWWSVEIAALLALVVYRAMARFREKLHGSSPT